MIYSTCAYRIALSILPTISDLIGQHWQSHMPGRVTTVLEHEHQQQPCLSSPYRLMHPTQAPSDRNTKLAGLPP
jgi:hypothetical protein